MRSPKEGFTTKWQNFRWSNIDIFRELLEDPYASTTNEIDDKNMSEEEGKLCGPGPVRLADIN